LIINPGFTEKELIPRKVSSEWKTYRLAWEEFPKRDILGPVPIHLDLELTARCQLRCPGCPSQKLDYGKGDMEVQLAENLLEEFGCRGGWAVKFNWRGEPTLHHSLVHLVKKAGDTGIIDRMLNTNGVLMDGDLSKKMILAGTTTVAWSIDSTDDVTYARLRPGAQLEQVLDNLDSFLQWKDLLDSDVYVRVQRIAYPDVIPAEPFEDFVEFFEKNYPGVNSVAENHYKEKSLEGDTRFPSKPCAQPWQRLVVSYDGKVGPCCEMNRFRASLGNAYKSTINEMWTSDSMEFLRQCHRDNQQNSLEACRRCSATKVFG